MPHVLKGGAKMKPGWIVLITVLVLGAVVGTILGIYFSGLNKVSQYAHPIKTSTSAPAKLSAPTPREATKMAAGCDGKVVNPAACMSSNGNRTVKARACTGCNSQQQCVNDQCQNLCVPNCPVNACQGSGSGDSTALDNGCGGKCCGCQDPDTCVNGQCTPPGTCNPACGAGSVCEGGTCKPINNTCPTTCLPGWSCVSGECKQDGNCPTVCKSNEKCVSGSCVCQPSCGPSSCGPDGCGGNCSCPSGQSCNTSTQTCSTCTPNCPSGSCGADGCGGVCACPSGQTCNSSTQTCTPACVPSCSSGSCGADGCGGTCACPAGQTCDSTTKKCITSSCTPNCPTGSCGPNGCGGTCACPAGQNCDNTTQKCTTGNCVPSCPSGSCGSDGCGNTCKCPTGQFCDTRSYKCCTPSCTEGSCAPDGCGGICPCPAGQMCQGGKCVTDPSPWEGWTTTTQFGSGDGPWGDSKNPAENLYYINNSVKGVMGGAVVWKEICKRYGTKNDQIASVVGSAAGTNSDKSCLLVQPINNYPDKISGLSDPLYPAASMCTGASCVDINDPSLAAVDGTGKPYPNYLIMPFEGCGGNCKVTSGSGPDCINDCVAGDLNSYGVNCQWDKMTNSLCGAAKVLYDGGNWGWNDTIKANFEQYSDMTAIDPRTEYGRNISNAIKGAGEDFANYCSGQNMHIDMAEDTPYWMNLPKNTNSNGIAYLTGDSNIMMRYKRVPCNYFGNININTPPYAGTSCPAGYTSIPSGSQCTGTLLKPGDANWPQSSLADHDCCESSPNANKCYSGQVYQAEGGACPCPSGQCFFNFTKPLDGSKGTCGQCSTNPTACNPPGIKC